MKKSEELDSRELDLLKSDPKLGNIAEVLHEFKMEGTYTQEEIAKLAMISRTTLHKIYHGKQDLKMLTLYDILGVHDKNLGDLAVRLGGQDLEHAVLLILLGLADGSIDIDKYLCKLNYTEERARNFLKLGNKIINFMLKL